MLKRLPDELPNDAALAIYGRGPGWLYGMLAAYAIAIHRPFYQFDPRIGWLAPPLLKMSTQPPSEEITVHVRESHDAWVLSIRINTDYLDHLQAEQLTFPPLPSRWARHHPRWQNASLAADGPGAPLRRSRSRLDRLPSAEP